jgi:hypothetical protein
MNNGRIDTVPNQNYRMYQLFETGNDCMSKFNREAIINIHQPTQLNSLYFSRKNIDALQQGIRNLVAEKTQGKSVIGKQSEVELQIVMRSVYLEHGKYQPDNILEQVRELNKRVLDFCVPRIIEEIRMYNYYKEDISRLPIPLDRGEFSSSKGTRILENKDF